MEKRVKRPLVEPAMRRKWYRLYEEKGWSIIKIAEKDDYDPRTVKSQIELERQERAEKEARVKVLQDRLSQHLNDLCNFTMKIDSHINSDRNTLAPLKEDSNWIPLYKHIRRSTIWKNLDKWEDFRNQITQLNTQIEQSLRAEINSYLKTVKKSYTPGLNIRLFNVLNTHIKNTVLLRPETLEKLDFEKIPECKNTEIKKLVQNVLKSVATRTEYNDLAQTTKELREVNRALRVELLIIQKRRMVSGRCHYCPF